MISRYSDRKISQKKDNVFDKCNSEILNFISRCVSSRVTAFDINQHSDSVAGGLSPISIGMGEIMDESKYTFVERIKTRIKDALDELLEKHLQADTNGEKVVPMIADTILGSGEYLKLVTEISNDAKQSATEILRHLPTKGGNRSYDATRSENSLSAHSSNTFQSESCSLGSLASGICPNDNELQLIAEQLDKIQPVSVRIRAAQVLATFSVGELLADEFWPSSKITLQLAMKDTEMKINTVAMEIYARAFKLAPPYMIPEIYTSYATQLIINLEEFLKTRSHSQTLNVRDPRTHLIIKQFRLMNQLMIHIPFYWFRFTEPICRQVLNVTGSLLLGSADYNRIPLDDSFEYSAVHFLALVDPGAVWCDKWMMSYVGRKHTIKTLSECGIISHLARFFVNFAKRIKNKVVKESLSNYAVSGFEAQYLKFLHIVFLFKKLALNRSGRQVFPLSISGESFTLDDFSICMLQLIDSDTSLSSEIFFLEGFDHSFRISSIVSSFIRDLSNADEYAQALICHPEHLKTLLEPLEAALSSPQKGNQNALSAISESLSFIASTVPGRKFLVEVLASEKSALLELVKKVVCTPLPSEQLSRRVIGAFVFFLRQIYKTYDGLVVLSSSSLHIALSQQMIKSPKTPEEYEWNTLLVDNILNFGSTPLGLVLLEETGMMLVCVEHMFSKKNLPISQYEPYGYGTLVSQIATTSQGMNALCLSGWIEAVINELWTIIECNEPFGPPELNIDDQRTGKTISNILKLFSTFSGLSACLKHEGEEGGPFTKLIHSLILIDLNFPSGSLGTFEESRQIGLRILKHLISSSLDASILLQVSFGYFESLEQQLKDSYCDGKLIVDENTLSINHILVRDSLVGGPNERTLPPLTIDGIDNFQEFVYDGIIKKDLTFPKNVNVEISNQFDAFQTLEKLKEYFHVTILKGNQPFSVASLINSAYSIINGSDTIIPALDPSFTPHSNPHISTCLKKGIKIAALYASRVLGCNGNQSPSITELETGLNKVINQTIQWQIVIPSSDTFEGFDWFAASVFIMCKGVADDTSIMLYKISRLPCAKYVWPQLGSKPQIAPDICHSVGAEMAARLDKVASSFTSSGCTPAQMVENWIRNVFWNIFDFNDIQRYICAILVNPPQYAISFYVALFEQLEQRILLTARKENLVHLFTDELGLTFQ